MFQNGKEIILLILYHLGLPFPTEDLIVILLILFIFYDFSYGFCTADFSDVLSPIFMKLLGLIDIPFKFNILFFILVTHFRSRYIVDFVKFRGSRYPEI